MKNLLSTYSVFCCMISFICIDTIQAQGSTDVSTYLCETYGSSKILPDYKPVKYVSSMYPKGVTAAEAWRIDSVFSQGDTIYYLASKFKEIVDMNSMTQQQADEVIKVLQSASVKGKTGTIECAKLANEKFDDSEIRFSQPLYTKDKTICLLTYELRFDVGTTKETLKPTRKTVVLKYNGKQWEDTQFLELQMMEIRD